MVDTAADKEEQILLVRCIMTLLVRDGLSTERPTAAKQG